MNKQEDTPSHGVGGNDDAAAENGSQAVAQEHAAAGATEVHHPNATASPPPPASSTDHPSSLEPSGDQDVEFDSAQTTSEHAEEKKIADAAAAPNIATTSASNASSSNVNNNINSGSSGSISSSKGSSTVSTDSVEHKAAARRRGSEHFHVTKLLTNDEPNASIEVVCFAERNKKTRARSTSNPTAVPLDLFRLQKTMVVPVDKLRKSPFFDQKLSGAWKHAYHVTIRLPRLGTVSALMHSLEFLVKGSMDVDPRNMFELLAISHFLKLYQLRQQCAMLIGDHLTDKNIIIAAHFAHKCNIPWLLECCYRWILINFVETGFLGQMLDAAASGKREPAAKGDVDAAPFSADLGHFATEENIEDFQHKLVLRHGLYNVPVAAFSPLYKDRLERSCKIAKPYAEHFVGSIVRERGDDNTGHFYKLCRQGVDKPLLVACYDEKAGEYVIAKADEKSRVEWHDTSCLGTVRSNLTGTQFSVFDYGMRTNNLSPKLFPAHKRVEYGIVKYQRNILGTVPRAFTIILRNHDPSEDPDPSVDLDSAFTAGRRDVLSVLHNKPPVWNDALQAYTLDFGDAVKLPSKKNFQLVPEDNEQGNFVLMFGKVRRDLFHLEFHPPMSLLMAFGIVLSSFDKKRFVT